MPLFAPSSASPLWCCYATGWQLCPARWCPKSLTAKLGLFWCMRLFGMRGRVCISSKFSLVFWCGSSRSRTGTAESMVWDGQLRNRQCKLLKLPQLLEEMLPQLWCVPVCSRRFLSDAVILFWIHFGWKVLRLFLHWTVFQTFGSCK